MKTLFDPATVDEVKSRIAQLHTGSQRLWGKMDLPQTLAHCSIGLQSATGDLKPPRVLLGRVLGPVIKRFAFKDDEPMRRNSPTAPSFVVTGKYDLASERARLSALIDSFAMTGPTGCTDHPHAFFGKLTPQEWGIIMYRHLDHHLRQFGA